MHRGQRGVVLDAEVSWKNEGRETRKEVVENREMTDRRGRARAEGDNSENA
jgi:hypothetical protein